MTRSVRVGATIEDDIAHQLDHERSQLFWRHDLASALALLAQPGTWESLPDHGGGRRLTVEGLTVGALHLEEYETSPSDERPVEEYLLGRAALARARSEHQMIEAVAAARAKGISWQRIGSLLGTSAQAAQQRYGTVIEAT